eukprot:1125012_1
MAECITRSFNASIDFIASALCLYFCHRYFKAESVSYSDQDRCLYIMTCVLFVFILIALITFGIYDAIYCLDAPLIHISALLGNTCYALQYVVLLAMLWRRLCIVFEDSPFAVSNRTKRIFWMTYALQILFAMAAVGDSYFSHNNNPLWSAISLILACCAVIVLIATLVGLFIFKLLVMSRIQVRTTVGNSDDTNGQRMELVTKLFILTLASIISFFVMLLVACIAYAVGIGDNVYLGFVYKLTLTMDTFTNFLSIVLGITELNHIYMNLWFMSDPMCGLLEKENKYEFAITISTCNWSKNQR